MEKKMKRRTMRLFAIVLSSIVIMTSIWADMGVVYATEMDGVMPILSENTGVTVSTGEEFAGALATGKSPIIISGTITIGHEADDSGRMIPVYIPGDTVIEGEDGAGLDCRCPIQITGDNVTIKNIKLEFASSDALGSVPHREIFLGGHSLTLDNVDTYLAGGGNLGGFGSSEEELLPSIYAGGFEGTDVGNAASLTVQNANEKTMFKAIYMGHDAGVDRKVAYNGATNLTVGPKVTVREGIYTDANSSATVIVTGEGNENSNLNNIAFYGNEQTTLTVTETNVNNGTVLGVGTLVLDEKAHFSLTAGSLGNVIVKNGACLNLNGMTAVSASGDFTGGTYDVNAQTDERGVLVLNENGSLDVGGTVSGTTILQTDNKNFAGELTVGKTYVISNALEEGSDGFVLCDEQAVYYDLVHENNGWTVYEKEVSAVESVEVVSYPKVVDVNTLSWGDEPDANVPYCEILWKDANGNALTLEQVDALGLYYLGGITGIKTEYWEDESVSSEIDWNIYVDMYPTDAGDDKYYMYSDCPESITSGSYTFLVCSEVYDGVLDTVADVKTMKESGIIKAEFEVLFYNSETEEAPEITPDPEPEPEYTDISDETITVEAIENQVYTGEAITPGVVVKNEETLLTEGEDYSITYENNINVGTDIAIVTIQGEGNYTGTRQERFSIVKADPQMTITINGEENDTISYAENLVVKVVVSPYVGNDSTDDVITFSVGEKSLGTATLDEKGIATFAYDTVDKTLAVGEHVVRASFEGNTNLNAQTVEASVEITKKSIATSEIASVKLQDFEGDGLTDTTEILSITDVNGSIYEATGTAKLASAQPGTYESAEIIEWSLTGEEFLWYQLPEAPKSIAVSPAVVISEQTSEPDPKPEPKPDPEKEGLWFELVEEEPYIYTGQPMKPGIRVYEGKDQLMAKDYKVSYSNNKNVGKDAVIKVTGKGNYKGTATINFEIVQKDIEDVEAPIVSAVINRKGQVTVPKVTLKYGKVTLKAEKGNQKNDYSVKDVEWKIDADGNILPGEYAIEVTGNGNYTGTKRIPFYVYANATPVLKMSNAKITIAEDSPIKTVDYFEAVKAKSEENYAKPVFTVKIGQTILTEDQYDIVWPTEWKVGKNTVTFKATTDKTNSITGTKTFKVTAVGGGKITASDIVITGINKNGYDFTGKSIDNDTLNLKVIKQFTGENGETSELVLEEGIDYTLSYKNNRKAGTASVVVKGIGGYSGSRTLKFRINKVTLSDEIVFVANEAVYKKTGATPEMKVVLASGYELVAGTDYKVSYTNNKEVGDNTATVRITGKGNFTGTLEKTFTVKETSGDTVTISKTEMLNPKKVSKVKVNVVETATGKKLKAGTDYTSISYLVSDGKGGYRTLTNEDLKNSEQLDVTVEVKLAGNYGTDVKESMLHIYSKKASAFIVELPQDTYEYTGKNIVPETVTVKVRDGKTNNKWNYKELVEGVDYTFTPGNYTNHVKVGTYKVTIKGEGIYGGTKTVNYKITKKTILFDIAEALQMWFF